MSVPDSILDNRRSGNKPSAGDLRTPKRPRRAHHYPRRTSRVPRD